MSDRVHIVRMIKQELKTVPISELKPKANNRNFHPEDQIERLAEIIKVQGFRRPIIVSNQSGEIVCGHGRLMAAKKLGMTEVPVLFQDYATPELEYADHIADNAVPLWASLDFSGINSDIGDLGPDFDIDLLGIKDFMIDVSEKDIKNSCLELNEEDFQKFQHECPKCGFEYNDAT